VEQSRTKGILQVHSINPLEVTITHKLTKQEFEPNRECVINNIDITHSLEISAPHIRKYALPFETLVPTNYS
jgi:hypothetical protein